MLVSCVVGHDAVPVVLLIFIACSGAMSGANNALSPGGFRVFDDGASDKSSRPKKSKTGARPTGGFQIFDDSEVC